MTNLSFGQFRDLVTSKIRFLGQNKTRVDGGDFGRRKYDSLVLFDIINDFTFLKK